MPDPAPNTTIRVSVAYADPQGEIVRRADVAANATVEAAIRASGILAQLADEFVPAAIGVFGRIVNAATRLHDGDRIELYRALPVDPKLLRRRRAES